MRIDPVALVVGVGTLALAVVAALTVVGVLPRAVDPVLLALGLVALGVLGLVLNRTVHHHEGKHHE